MDALLNSVPAFAFIHLVSFFTGMLLGFTGGWLAKNAQANEIICDLEDALYDEQMRD